MARLTKKEALKLLQQTDALELAEIACAMRDKIHPQGYITFVVDRNINYTNICQVQCKFCAFYREEGNIEGYVLSVEEICEKVKEAQEMGATQVMLQGGLHPSLGLKYFAQVFSKIKERFSVTIHSLSPPEIDHIAKLEGLSIKETLLRLKELGLDSVPGGGAEVLVDRVRQTVSPRKISSNRWLEIMEEAHKIGMESTATMMMGSIETEEELLEHLEKIRDLQDKTGGFRAFIPWTFQPAHTALGGKKISSIRYLRFLAVSRLFLDNFKTIQGSWVTQGPQMGQMAIYFGANDLGSIMLEENVVKAAGTAYTMEKESMIQLIKDTGKRPALRDTLYNILKVY